MPTPTLQTRQTFQTTPVQSLQQGTQHESVPRLDNPPVVARPSINTHDLATPTTPFPPSPEDLNPFRTPVRSTHASIDFSQRPTSSARPTLSPGRSTNTNPFRRMPDDMATAASRSKPGVVNELQPRNVQSAQDMYDGQMPPEYQSRPGGHGAHCGQCGERRHIAGQMVTPGQPLTQEHGCTKCGKRRSTEVPLVHPTPVRNHLRNVSGEMASTVPPSSQPTSSAAGSSSPASTGAGKRKCHKCGKHRRPPSSLPAASSPSDSSRQPPVGLSYVPARGLPQLQTRGMPVGINIEPPTASVYKRGPFSPAETLSETPLVGTARKQEFTLFGHNSISSIVRSFSSRRKSSNQRHHKHPLPSQQLHGDDHQNPSRLIDMISNAIRDSDGSGNYAKLKPGDAGDRPKTPFSFVDKVNEDDAFEMSDMRKSKMDETRKNSWEHRDETSSHPPRHQTSLAAPTPKFGRSQSTRTVHGGGNTALAVPPHDATFLGATPDQRPGITRFKSLRAGVTRATSTISRSSSLRRLESVKRVPQLWYRNDMSLEGANSESVVYVY